MAENVKGGYTQEGYRITVRTRGAWALVIFMAFWLALWTQGGVAAIKSVIQMASNTGDYSNPAAWFPIFFMLVWLAGWLAGETFAVFVVLWGFWGREIIQIAQGEMTVKSGIPVYYFTRKFYVSGIGNIRSLYQEFDKYRKDPEFKTRTMEQKREDKKTRGLNGLGVLAFTYEGRTHRFGMAFLKPDVDLLINELKKTLPSSKFEGSGDESGNREKGEHQENVYSKSQPPAELK